MLNEFSQWEYVILNPRGMCVILSDSSVLITCLAFLDINSVPDKSFSCLFFWQA